MVDAELALVQVIEPVYRAAPASKIVSALLQALSAATKTDLDPTVEAVNLCGMNQAGLLAAFYPEAGRAWNSYWTATR
jgi:hypothetical protein